MTPRHSVRTCDDEGCKLCYLELMAAANMLQRYAQMTLEHTNTVVGAMFHRMKQSNLKVKEMDSNNSPPQLCDRDTPLHGMDANYCTKCGAQILEDGTAVTPNVPTLLSHVHQLEIELDDVLTKD